MTRTDTPSPEMIRTARLDAPKLRDRDLAVRLGISEGHLVAAHVGRGVTRISPEMDRLIPALNRLGEVMALTRNESCVIEKVGTYDGYRGGQHAALVVNGEIDLRLFPRHWAHGFAVEKLTETGLRQSIQIFDAAGDAVHKVYLRETSVVEEWDGLIEGLRVQDQGQTLNTEPFSRTEPAKGDPDQADRLRAKWDKMTDTHQFMMMVRKLKMNRLGAYRIAGAPYVRPLALDTVETLLTRAADTALPIMAFVGNAGCIEIHTGPIRTLKPMGPWLNVLDARFNLHLRSDHIAEVWQVTKSTRRGDAVSVEAFDKDGMLIVQLFGVLAEPDAAQAWNQTVFSLQGLKEVQPA